MRIAWPETLAIVAIGLVAIEFSPPARERSVPRAGMHAAFEAGARAQLRPAEAAPVPGPASRHDDAAAALRRP